MHPLVAICLVFLAGLAWTVTVLTLLAALAKARRSPRHVDARVPGAKFRKPDLGPART